MYEPPIEVVMKQMRTKFDNGIYQAVQEYGVVVDKEELIRALRYDRDQYENGYADGLAADKWISVKDRLPEGGDYLTCNDSKRLHIYSYAKNLSKVDKDDFYRVRRGGWYDYDSEWGFCEVKGVTHWMPLPEPPKGERLNGTVY